MQLFSFRAAMAAVVATLLCAAPHGFAQPASEASASGSKVLTIGSKAPSLDIEHWVSQGQGSFDKVTEFAPGKVYVVEFWATWCGPCIASMPHLVEIQQSYADKGVQIVSVSDEPLETVEGFLAKPVRGAEASAEGEDGETAIPTYGDLTSAYCLTTDPDGSVKEDYMRAASQNGIPTSFIVGKDGKVEWIGHPMAMDEPLQQIVEGTWDREAFGVDFRKSQQRDRFQMQLMQKISAALRQEPVDMDAVRQILDEAKSEVEGDEQMVAILEGLRFRVMVQPAMMLDQEGKFDEADPIYAAALEKVSPDQQQMVYSMRIQILIRAEEFGRAAEILSDLAAAEGADGEMLNQHAWRVYLLGNGGTEVAPELLAAAVEAAETAVAAEPENGSYYDTLAHLLHLQGDLDRAIQVQEKAANNPGPSKVEIDAYLQELKAEKKAG